MPKKVLAQKETPKGIRRIIRWATRESDLSKKGFGCPKKIQKKEQEDLAVTLEFFVNTGSFPKNDEKFKQLRGDLFEVKTWKYRIYGYFDRYNLDFTIITCLFKNQRKAGEDNIKHGLKLIDKAKLDMEFVK